MSLHLKLAEQLLKNFEHTFKALASEIGHTAGDEWKKVLSALKGHAEEKLEAIEKKAEDAQGDMFHLQDHQKVGDHTENVNPHVPLEATEAPKPEDKPTDIAPTGQSSESPAAETNIVGSEAEAEKAPETAEEPATPSDEDLKSETPSLTESDSVEPEAEKDPAATDMPS